MYQIVVIKKRGRHEVREIVEKELSDERAARALKQAWECLEPHAQVIIEKQSGEETID